MKTSTLLTFSTTVITLTLAQQFQVPVPWLISGLTIQNIRHGTGGFWNLNITDTPTVAPQGFKTSCAYRGNTYYFAIDDAPYDAPCNNPNVTFGLFPNGDHFTLNVTHVYDCSNATITKSCSDNGTWAFSNDDVRGQEVDVQNNFGQAGSFSHEPFQMYPKRAVASSKCEFC